MIRASWTQTASIEETLALWAASLREIKKRIRPLFGQERVAKNAGLFLEGLLGDEQRKTGWVRAEAAGDTVYGVGSIEQQLRRAGKGYVLWVSSAHVFRSWGKRRSVAGTAADIAKTRRASDWKRLSAGAGTKGPRLHDWCYLELADLEVEESNDANPGLWTRGLLIRRRIADDDLAFFTTWCPAGTSIETLVAVEGHRWAIEDGFETAKNAFGLDHNESRSWHGWHRHVSMVTLAFAMMAAIRHRANPPPPKKPAAEPRQKPKHRHAAIDPLVNPGSPTHRHQTRSKADPTRTYHRMVTLAKSSSGDSAASALQSKKTTVMLVLLVHFAEYSG